MKWKRQMKKEQMLKDIQERLEHSESQCRETSCSQCTYNGRGCTLRLGAEALYNAGYRRSRRGGVVAEKVRRETATEILRALYYCEGENITEKIAELIEKYKVEV